MRILIHTLTASFLILLCSYSNQALAQTDDNNEVEVKTKGDANKVWTFDLHLMADFPKADMATRFGTNYRIGFGIKYKTDRNWMIGAKLDFLIGNKIKEDSLLINVKTYQGSIIDQNGDLLNVGIFERGYLAGIQVGKVFNVLALNNNSGLMWMSTIGFMQHKIKFFDKNNAFPQLNNEYKKGYDRLTNGAFLETFLGYNYMSKDRYLNFYTGLNLTWGFTQGRRTYLYDVARTDQSKRKDVLIGLKLGWMLPIYKKTEEELYY
ncbi:MAG: hypothetical protein R2831_08575 [Chitinophagaceae bacterium]